MKTYNQPTALVIFDGTGNLAKTKLIPALLDLFGRGLLPDAFSIIGISRKELPGRCPRRCSIR